MDFAWKWIGAGAAGLLLWAIVGRREPAPLREDQAPRRLTFPIMAPVILDPKPALGDVAVIVQATRRGVALAEERAGDLGRVAASDGLSVRTHLAEWLAAHAIGEGDTVTVVIVDRDGALVDAWQWGPELAPGLI